MAYLIQHWTTLAPLGAAALLVLTTAIGEQPWLLVGCVVAIIAAVLAAVHHAEVIAHRVGEPLGTLVLALAVTVIEAALLLSLLFSGGAGMETLPRDTVYATVMIITTGVVGLCTMIGRLTHREQSSRRRCGAFSSSSRPSGTATTSYRTMITPAPNSMPCPPRGGRRR